MLSKIIGCCHLNRESPSFPTRNRFGTAQVLATAYIIEYSYPGDSVMDEFISVDQMVYIKDARTISDIVEQPAFQNRPGILTLLDFEKAFDTVSWSLLHVE